jgi:hypothetical protein
LHYLKQRQEELFAPQLKTMKKSRYYPDQFEDSRGVGTGFSVGRSSSMVSSSAGELDELPPEDEEIEECMNEEFFYKPLEIATIKESSFDSSTLGRREHHARPSLAEQ